VGKSCGNGGVFAQPLTNEECRQDNAIRGLVREEARHPTSPHVRVRCSCKEHLTEHEDVSPSYG
jgi:hypothetical protein